MDCLLVLSKQRAGVHMVCMLVLPEPEDWSMHGLPDGIARTRGLEHVWFACWYYQNQRTGACMVFLLVLQANKTYLTCLLITSNCWYCSLNKVWSMHGLPAGIS